MRQIFLGQGCSSESHKGLIGSTILVAQAQAAKTEILPSINKLLDTLEIVFGKSVDEVRQCRALTVNRAAFLQCLELHQKVCPSFFDVQIDRSEAQRLPADAVPDEFVNHAVTLEDCQKILGRQIEIQRAQKPGRYKDSDVQIFKFAKIFAPVLEASHVQKFPFPRNPKFAHLHAGDA